MKIKLFGLSRAQKMEMSCLSLSVRIFVCAKLEF